jgi:hypothetical protein
LAPGFGPVLFSRRHEGITTKRGPKRRRTEKATSHENEYFKMGFFAAVKATCCAHCGRASTEQTDDRIHRGKLTKLCKMRFRNHCPPDNDAGRAMLVALLRFGLTNEAATKDAPWCEAELPVLEHRAKRMKWCDVGKLLGLTFEEWKKAKLWVLRPVDATDEEVQAWREKRRKESLLKSKAKQCAREIKERQAMLANETTKTTPRQTAILEILIGRDGLPMSVPEMIKEASKSPAFTRTRCRNTTWSNGPPASAIVRNMRDAVHETLNQLERKRAVATDRRPGERGMVRWVTLRKLRNLQPRQDEQAFIFDGKKERRTVGYGSKPKPKTIQRVKPKKPIVALPKKEEKLPCVPTVADNTSKLQPPTLAGCNVIPISERRKSVPMPLPEMARAA